MGLLIQWSKKFISDTDPSKTDLIKMYEYNMNKAIELKKRVKILDDELRVEKQGPNKGRNKFGQVVYDSEAEKDAQEGFEYIIGFCNDMIKGNSEAIKGEKVRALERTEKRREERRERWKNALGKPPPSDREMIG